jgi:hypothetical protein
MTRTRATSTIGILFLIASCGQLLHAQPGWVYLGEANVDGAVDHDRIVVTGARGQFTAIQIRVERAAVEFEHVVVHFGNGSSDPIPIRSRIPAGGQTRVIDLPGNRRVIESVEFWYSRASRSPQKPKVRLFGRR